jgi:hypothetical protein
VGIHGILLARQPIPIPFDGFSKLIRKILPPSRLAEGPRPEVRFSETWEIRFPYHSSGESPGQEQGDGEVREKIGRGQGEMAFPLIRDQALAGEEVPPAPAQLDIRQE